MIKSIAIGLIGLAGAFNSAALIYYNDRVASLQEQVRALKNVQDGVDIHLQFTDSDHRRLQQEIVDMRRDLDEQRFLHGGPER